MQRLSALVVGSVLVSALAGCTFSPGAAGSDISTGSPGSAGITGGNTGRGGSVGTGTGNSSAGGDIGQDAGNCGQSNHGAMKTPGDLLLIQDKSGSMNNDFTDQACRGGGACTQKWPVMTAALNQVIAQTQASINWGLKFFANNNTCTVNAGVAIAPALNNANAIAAAIAGTAPGGNTPTRAAVETGTTYMRNFNSPNPKYILLATDGEPNCNPDPNNGGNTVPDDAGAVAAVANAYAGGSGIPVFVVGIGSLGTAVATLNSMANAGGEAQPADAMGRVYFPADNQAQLEAALAKISGQVLSCNFTLDSVPPVPSNIVVETQTRTVIPQSTTNGWSYGPGNMSVIINGTYCDQIKAGTITSIGTIYGCPGVGIVP
jgi:von Willebrand factor type A domain